MAVIGCLRVVTVALVAAAGSAGALPFFNSTSAFAQATNANTNANRAVETFLAAPRAWLGNFPNGGPAMTSSTRDLAVASPSTLSPILGLLPESIKSQKTAIGAGLAQAARVVVRGNPTFANQIQQAIAETKDQDVFLAYTSGSGDQSTGSVGGGGGAGGGGALGGQTAALNAGPTSTGPAQGIPGSSFPTGPFTISSNVGTASVTTSP